MAAIRTLSAAVLLTACAWPAASAAATCGPGGRTLAENGTVRAYVRAGDVLACHRGRSEPVVLGRRAAVLDLRVAGRHVGVVAADRIAVHDVRRRWVVGRRRLPGPLTRWILDRAGIAAYIVRGPAGRLTVASTLSFPLARADDIEPRVLGLAGAFVAYRRGDTYEIAENGLDPERHAAARTLASVGRVRIAVRDRLAGYQLTARTPTAARSLGDPLAECGLSANGCAGIDAFQVDGGYVAVRRTEVNRDYAAGSVTAARVDGGRVRRSCAGPGVVRAFALSDAGTPACARTPIDLTTLRLGVPEVQIDGQVIASGPGIDTDSLRRRGAELVWMQDGILRAAPFAAAAAPR